MRGVAPVPCPEVSPGGVVVEGRIVEAVAGGAVLSGTPAELARRLRVRAEDLMVAVGELVAVGWLRVSFDGGRVSLRWNADVAGPREAPARRGRARPHLDRGPGE